MITVLVFAGGDTPPPDALEDLPEAGLAVAADGGYDIARALGHPVDVVIGDLDSTTEVPDHVVVERHPEDKDATDLELAMMAVLAHGPERVVVVGGTGGRHDHELGTAGLICSPRWDRIDEIDWVSARGRAHVVRGRLRRFHGDLGSIISLIPQGGDAIGVRTRGLKWELDDETLRFGSTRGISNVLVTPVVEVSVRAGCLLAVFPTT